MNIEAEKNRIRKEIKLFKENISLEEKQKKSSQLFENIERLDVFKNAKTILLYWSMQDEVDTHDFILKWFKEKKILLPCVVNEILELKEFKGMKQMKTGEAFGIAEPTGKIFSNYSEIDLSIIPGIAFDKQNNRLGRGKAFYDRLLKNIPSCKIGVGFDFQLLDKIPVSATDVRMDLIMTY